MVKRILAPRAQSLCRTWYSCKTSRTARQPHLTSCITTLPQECRTSPGRMVPLGHVWQELDGGLLTIRKKDTPRLPDCRHQHRPPGARRLVRRQRHLRGAQAVLAGDRDGAPFAHGGDEGAEHAGVAAPRVALPGGSRADLAAPARARHDVA